MKIALFGPSLSQVLAATLAGPVVAVQDDKTEVVEHWTPAGLAEIAQCYIGQVNGRFLLYERTSALRCNTQRATYPDSYTNAEGIDVRGPAKYVNPGDEEGFASVAKLKQFYAETNPAFEAAHPTCLPLSWYVGQVFTPEGRAMLDTYYGRVVRGKHWFSLSGKD